MKDLLDEATRALREETGAERDPETLERVLVARRRGKVRSLRWLAWPLAATLVVLTALAGASGKLGRVLTVIGFDRAEEGAGTGPGGGAPTVGTPSAIPVLPEAPSAASTPAEAPTPVVSVNRPNVRPGVPAAALPVPSGSARETPDELYRRATQAHFVEHDYARAVGLWDRYLQAGGPLALEARYNRAVALLRAGRTGEARAALAPFAAGEYGAYRRREAQALLDALPPP